MRKGSDLRSHLVRTLALLVVAAVVPACGSSGSSGGGGGGGAPPGGGGGTPGTPGAAASTAQFPASTSSDDLLGIVMADLFGGVAVGEFGAVLVTGDGGDTWSRGNSGTVEHLRGVDNAVGSTSIFVAVGDNATILRSTNSGATWAPIAPPASAADPLTPVSAQLNGVAFADADVVIAVGAGGTILRSADAGLTWIDRTDTATLTANNLNAAAFADASVGVVVGDAGTILRTTNAGVVWGGVTTNGSGGLALRGVSFGDADDGVAVGDVSIFTDDAGDVWTAATTGAGTMNGVSMVDAGNAWAVGAGGSIQRTTDGGINWSGASDLSPTFNTLRAVSMVALGGVVNAADGVAVGDLGTILRFWDHNGDNTDAHVWTIEEEAPLFNLTDVDAVAGGSDFVCAVGTDGTLLRSTDGGTTWEDVSDGLVTTNNLNAVQVLSATVGFAAGQSKTLIKTVNGGDVWEVKNTGMLNRHLNAVHFFDANTGVVLGQSGYIGRTTDGGENWATVTGTGSTTFQAADFVGSTGFAIFGNTGLLTTADSGATWTAVTTDLPNAGGPLRGVDFLGSLIGYVIKNGAIFKTVDGGATWVDMTTFGALPSVTGSFTSVAFVDDFHGYVTTNAGEILKTEDGETFELLAQATNQALNAARFLTATKGWAVGNRGVIIKVQ